MAKKITYLELKKIKRLNKKGYSPLKISYELDRNLVTIRKKIKELGLSKGKQKGNIMKKGKAVIAKNIKTGEV